MKQHWKKRFIDLAYLISTWSKDPSTKCGCTIVSEDKKILSHGYNGFPRMVKDDKDRYDNREIKYRMVVHSEINAILNSKHDLKDSILFVVPMPPCSQCAAAIIQSGIKKVITIEPSQEKIERWGLDFEITNKMFKEAKIEMEYI